MTMLFASGFLNFTQNLVTFTLIHKLTALSYAVANATKRITIISVSLVTLKNPVTPINIFGMFLSVIGVLGYNRVFMIFSISKLLALNITLVCLQQVKQRQKAITDSPVDMTLPFSMSDPLLPDTEFLRNSSQLLPIHKRDLDLTNNTLYRKETSKNSARFYISTPMEEV